MTDADFIRELEQIRLGVRSVDIALMHSLRDLIDLLIRDRAERPPE